MPGGFRENLRAQPARALVVQDHHLHPTVGRRVLAQLTLELGKQVPHVLNVAGAVPPASHRRHRLFLVGEERVHQRLRIRVQSAPPQPTSVNTTPSWPPARRASGFTLPVMITRRPPQRARSPVEAFWDLERARRGALAKSAVKCSTRCAAHVRWTTGTAALTRPPPQL